MYVIKISLYLTVKVPLGFHEILYVPYNSLRVKDWKFIYVTQFLNRGKRSKHFPPNHKPIELAFSIIKIKSKKWNKYIYKK